MVFRRLRQEQRLQLAQLVGIAGGEVVVLRVVVSDVVEFPLVVVDLRKFFRSHKPGWCRRSRARIPAIVIDSAIGKHLEILRVALRGRVGIRLVECIGHAHAFDGLLRDAIDRGRSLDACGFEDRRHDVDHMMELGADATGVRDVAGP